MPDFGLAQLLAALSGLITVAVRTAPIGAAEHSRSMEGLARLVSVVCVVRIVSPQEVELRIVLLLAQYALLKAETCTVRQPVKPAAAGRWQ